MLNERRNAILVQAHSDYFIIMLDYFGKMFQDKNQVGISVQRDKSVELSGNENVTKCRRGGKESCSRNIYFPFCQNPSILTQPFNHCEGFSQPCARTLRYFIMFIAVVIVT